MVACMSLNAQTPLKDWVYEWFHPDSRHCSGYPGPDSSNVIGPPPGPPGHEPLTNQTYTIIDLTIGGNPCVDTSVIQNPDSVGIDNKPYLNDAEIVYINLILSHSNNQFDLRNKKIAFIAGSDGQGIMSKIDFFKKCFGDSIGSNRKPHVTMEVLNKKEKMESGGYDVLLKYKAFPYTYRLKRKVIRKLRIFGNAK